MKNDRNQARKFCFFVDYAHIRMRERKNTTAIARILRLIFPLFNFIKIYDACIRPDLYFLQIVKRKSLPYIKKDF
ncbi:MAG: hypothetical protein DI535_02510 [Citrobacter freundii]|nr:MAG: hypothetical protein DI535_02510 [Citrobacter freundii]